MVEATVLFTRRILNFIGWLRARKILVIILIVGLEALIGFTDHWVNEVVPIATLHYLTIVLATIIYEWRGALTLSITATISFYLANYDSIIRSDLGFPSVGLTFLVFLTVSGGVVLILRLLNSLQASNQALAEKLALLQASRAQIELLTSERERLRLARELHDGVAKTLLGVEYSAAALRRVVESTNPQLVDRIGFIEKVCHDEAQQLREVIYDLRQGYKEPLFELVTAYTERWQTAYNRRVHLKITGSDQAIHPATVYELMAILQESLENVQRHSQANQVWVRLDVNGRVHLQISDNGQGLSPELLDYYHQADELTLRSQAGLLQPYRSEDGRPHFGLNGMLERAEWLGGQLEYKKATEGGLLVDLVVPLKFGSEEV